MPVSSFQAARAALLTALAVAACGSVEETLIERGHRPAYAAGYADGCASGNEAAGGLFADVRKDASRYGADDQYTEGWDVGFEECRRDGRHGAGRPPAQPQQGQLRATWRALPELAPGASGGRRRTIGRDVDSIAPGSPRSSRRTTVAVLN